MNNRIQSFQGLRAIAFICIFLDNVTQVFGGPYLVPLGNWGVSIFFVLSGFLMTYNYYPNEKIIKESNFHFMLKKMSKLYVLHIAMLLMLIPFSIRAITITPPQTIQITSNLLLDILLLTMWIPLPQFLSVNNHPAWYLCACAFHYLIFPFIIKIIRRWNKNSSAIKTIVAVLFTQLLLTVFAGIAEYNNWFYESFVYWFTYKFPLVRLLDFILGCCLGYLFINTFKNDISKKIKIKNSLIEIVLIIIVLLSWILALYGKNCYKHTAVFTLSTLLIIWFCAKSQGIISRILSTNIFIQLGNISSNAFLILYIVALYVNAVNRHIFNETINAIILIVITFIITIIVSILYNKLWKTIKIKKSKGQN